MPAKFVIKVKVNLKNYIKITINLLLDFKKLGLEYGIMSIINVMLLPL